MRAIEIENLCKVYVRDVIDVEHGRLRIRFRGRRTEALRDLSLTVEKGEIFGLLGPNGAGKTTTIKILMGIHFATSGRARILDRPLGDREVKARIGYLPENPYFYDYLRGWEFLDFYGQLYGIPKSERRKRIEALMDQVGLSHAVNLPLRGYSKGMNQRIGLAQALLNDPEMVVLDEPQSGLDPLGRKDVRDLILNLRDRGHTVMFSSHILQDAELICDRVAILNQGRLKALGRLKELLSGRIRQWEVMVEGADAGQMERWRPQMLRLIENEGQYLAIVDQEGLASEIIRHALGQGGKLISLTPRKETLEEYFISEVGSEERGA
jgi:ABC-2 type transport system ATP-binding protein